MPDDDLVALVEQMRKLQREFYSLQRDDRPPDLFPRCRAIEKQVDAALERRRSAQLTLFGD